jgi:N6-adenosine-specific RNA methylase IME4
MTKTNIAADLRRLDRGAYSVVYADPPWSFKTWGKAGQDRAPDQHYATMPTEAIASLGVKDVAARDALLFLWVYQPMLVDALDVMGAWGFRYVTLGYVWVKVSGRQPPLFVDADMVPKGLGYYTRAGVEQALIGKRGKGVSLESKSEAQVVFAPRREHSRKPDEIARSIVRLAPAARRLELFARTRREGWDCLGNEIGKFDPREVA